MQKCLSVGEDRTIYGPKWEEYLLIFLILHLAPLLFFLISLPPFRLKAAESYENKPVLSLTRDVVVVFSWEGYRESLFAGAILRIIGPIWHILKRDSLLHPHPLHTQQSYT